MRPRYAVDLRRRSTRRSLIPPVVLPHCPLRLPLFSSLFPLPSSLFLVPRSYFHFPLFFPPPHSFAPFLFVQCRTRVRLRESIARICEAQLELLRRKYLYIYGVSF